MTWATNRAGGHALQIVTYDYAEEAYNEEAYPILLTDVRMQKAID